MQVILREHVDNLGRRGEIVKVADGYARNYLLPRKLALLATEGNKKQIERERGKFVVKEAEEQKVAEAMAERLGALDIAIAKKVGAVIINPTDSDAIVPTVKKLNAAKIPVITVDRAANGGTVAAHIASDNVAGGRMAAAYVARRLKGKGNVVMLEGIAGSSAARDRGKGFREGLQKFPGIKIVASQTADFDRSKGLTVMENILQAQKKIDAVFAQNDEMALGAVQAIEGAKRQQAMFVVGFDAIADALKAVNEGRIAATIAQQPKVMGRLAVEAAASRLKGGKVAKFTPVPLRLVTKNS